MADRVLELYEQGVSLQKQAVLFRAAHHSADLEIELARRRIPFVKYGGLRYLEAAHVKDLLAAFRLADNPRDEMAWFRLFQLMPGVGPAKARRAIDALRDADGKIPLSHNELQRRWSGVNGALSEDAERWRETSPTHCAHERTSRCSCTRNGSVGRSRRSSRPRMTTRRRGSRTSALSYWPAPG